MCKVVSKSNPKAIPSSALSLEMFFPKYIWFNPNLYTLEISEINPLPKFDLYDKIYFESILSVNELTCIHQKSLDASRHNEL